MLAVGFQHSIKHGLTRDTEVVIKSIDAARTVIQIMIERLYPTGYLRYAMQANFLYVSFAAAFLINVSEPKIWEARIKVTVSYCAPNSFRYSAKTCNKK